MHLVLGRLGRSPAEFWAMTPRELKAVIAGAMGEATPASPLGRDALASLMMQFPD